jgi:hypothetical protein
MNTTTRVTTGNSFWDNISFIANNILAHVNISFDGSARALRIDIVPTDNRIVENPKAVIKSEKIKCLEKAESVVSTDENIEESVKPVEEEASDE